MEVHSSRAWQRRPSETDLRDRAALPLRKSRGHDADAFRFEPLEVTEVERVKPIAAEPLCGDQMQGVAENATSQAEPGDAIDRRVNAAGGGGGRG